MRISDWSSDVCSSDLQQQSRGQTLQAEINVLIAKYNEEAKKTPQNQAALQAAAKAVQDKRQAAQQELGRIGAPVDLAIAYVEDQISVRMNEAIKAAMTAKKVDLLLNPDAVLARAHNVDITAIGRAHVRTPVTTAHIV